jgi:hypothetical protein
VFFQIVGRKKLLSQLSFFYKKIDFLARAREEDPAGVHCYWTGVHSNFLFGSCSQLRLALNRLKPGAE